MENLNRDTIIYSLNVQDVQVVALQEVGRELSQQEIEKIRDLIASNINWYDAISASIQTSINAEATS
jgi:hypothetical protein